MDRQIVIDLSTDLKAIRVVILASSSNKEIADHFRRSRHIW